MRENNLTLVIMAAGMGSRFGGLKQIEPMGPNGEFIIDYSIYDAKKAGFTKVVFIINEENDDVFKQTIGKRLEDKIEVSYVFQNLKNLPDGFSLPKERIKPLGTAQAILCCKDIVDAPFAIINADDFYGEDAYVKAAEYLKTVQKNSCHYAMVGYAVKNTISDNGSVKRGVCTIENNFLADLIESKIEKVLDTILATPLNTKVKSFPIEEEKIVSMNMFLFTPTIFAFIEEYFVPFLKENKDNLDTCEYLIPDLIQQLIKENKITVQVKKTSSVWYGVTYKEDKSSVQESIEEMIREKIYPRKLW